MPHSRRENRHLPSSGEVRCAGEDGIVQSPQLPLTALGAPACPGAEARSPWQAGGARRRAELTPRVRRGLAVPGNRGLCRPHDHGRPRQHRLEAPYRHNPEVGIRPGSAALVPVLVGGWGGVGSGDSGGGAGFLPVDAGHRQAGPAALAWAEPAGYRCAWCRVGGGVRTSGARALRDGASRLL